MSATFRRICVRSAARLAPMAPLHDLPVTVDHATRTASMVTSCGRIRIGRRKINLARVVE